MDETNTGLEDHDAVEEALIVRIRSALQGRNRYAYSHGQFNSQLIVSSSYSPRESNFFTGTS